MRKKKVHRKGNSQAALEFLLTYGWALVVIALAVSVLYALGFLNFSTQIPTSLIITGPITLKPSFAAANSSVFQFLFSNNLPFVVNLTGAKIIYDNVEYTNFICNNMHIYPGLNSTCDVTGLSLPTNNRVSLTLDLAFTPSSTAVPSVEDFSVIITPENVALSSLVFLETTVFGESNLPAGLTWKVTYDGVQKSSQSGSAILFATPAGNFSYSIAAVSVSAGSNCNTVYSPSPGSGYFKAGVTQPAGVVNTKFSSSLVCVYTTTTHTTKVYTTHYKTSPFVTTTHTTKVYSTHYRTSPFVTTTHTTKKTATTVTKTVKTCCRSSYFSYISRPYAYFHHEVYRTGTHHYHYYYKLTYKHHHKYKEYKVTKYAVTYHHHHKYKDYKVTKYVITYHHHHKYYVNGVQTRETTTNTLKYRTTTGLVGTYQRSVTNTVRYRTASALVGTYQRSVVTTTQHKTTKKNTCCTYPNTAYKTHTTGHYTGTTATDKLYRTRVVTNRYNTYTTHHTGTFYRTHFSSTTTCFCIPIFRYHYRQEAFKTAYWYWKTVVHIKYNTYILHRHHRWYYSKAARYTKTTFSTMFPTSVASETVKTKVKFETTKGCAYKYTKATRVMTVVPTIGC